MIILDENPNILIKENIGKFYKLYYLSETEHSVPVIIMIVQNDNYNIEFKVILSTSLQFREGTLHSYPLKGTGLINYWVIEEI